MTIAVEKFSFTGPAGLMREKSNFLPASMVSLTNWIKRVLTSAKKTDAKTCCSSIEGGTNLSRK